MSRRSVDIKKKHLKVKIRSTGGRHFLSLDHTCTEVFLIPALRQDYRANRKDTFLVRDSTPLKSGYYIAENRRHYSVCFGSVPISIHWPLISREKQISFLKLESFCSIIFQKYCINIYIQIYLEILLVLLLKSYFFNLI